MAGVRKRSLIMTRKWIGKFPFQGAHSHTGEIWNSEKG
jgi:hypothetical protein